MEPSAIEVAALGRTLFPGMLYDCRSDSFIPGITLWDKASLTKDLDVRQRPNTDLKFSASDSLSDKAKLLDVSASLKASFLGGLVEVGGSAKYLIDKKTSTSQSRVTMHYSQTTTFEQLTMTQLGKITYPKVFEEKTATHVVTAVLYGSQVFMVFDQTAKENENKQEIEANLHAMVTSIPCFSQGGKVALKMDEKQKKLSESIHCTFYGDCVLEENPTTYTEALHLYKKLPTLLKQKENNAVPLRVWLYPLAQLDSRAAKLERDVSASLVSKVESLLEELEDAQKTFYDLDKSDAANKFQDVKERLKKFQNSFSDYELMFKKSLSKILPAIRGGDANATDLNDILNVHTRSPFVAAKLKKWLKNVQVEINLVNSYIRELSGVPVMTSEVELNNLLFDPRVDTVVCFSFTSLKYEDPYLSSLSEFLTADEFQNLTPISTSSDQDSRIWLDNPDISEKMKKNLFLFKSFADDNKDQLEKTRFVIASVSDSSNPGASIHLYREGKIVDSKFQPGYKPPAPSVGIRRGNVILGLQKSPTGVTERYRVEYRETQQGETVAAGEKWEFIDTPDAEEIFVITGLSKEKKYHFRYRVVSEIGMSEASDSVEQLWDWNTISTLSDLKQKIVRFSSRWSLSTIKSELSYQASNIVSPYEGPIPAQLKPGMALFFQGVVCPDATKFTINCTTGPTKYDDVLVHFSPHLQQDCVVIGTLLDGCWVNCESTKGCPLRQGTAFDIFIVIGTKGFEVHVNGAKTYVFRHNVPVKNVTTLCITNTFMSHIGIIPDKPYVGPARLKPGFSLFFQGVVPIQSESFVINLKSGPGDCDDVVFHFNPRVGTSSVVCDSLKKGIWENPIKTLGGPFLKGGSFEILMIVEENVFEVHVNGMFYCTFHHRMPIQRVSTLQIKGDVFIHTFHIIIPD